MGENDSFRTGLSRRALLRAAAAAAGGSVLPPRWSRGALSPATAKGAASIDRQTLVRRHNPVVRSFDPFSALTVGNGSFAFTADLTGLQSFPDLYDKQFPLCTAAHWAWHTAPKPPEIADRQLRYKNFDAHGRAVGYAVDDAGQEGLFDWLRRNPHRLHLGQIGLVLNRADGSRATSADVSAAEQTLDLWTGTLSSRFRWCDTPVEVTTACDRDQDTLAVRVRSPLLRDGRLRLRIAFPYGSPDMDMADWRSPQKHQTTATMQDGIAQITRTLDATTYYLSLCCLQGKWTQTAAHELTLVPNGVDSLDAVIAFRSAILWLGVPTVEQTLAAAAEHWQGFWSDGGAIDLSASTDARAPELERRIVLSQYNTALHCAGPMPPPESGLLFNTWYGKSHLEMHWWHGVHFAAWNRMPLLARSFDWYRQIMPVARETAQRQGYDGVRWPKMVGPEGRDSPSPVGPLLIWQQPHLMYFAELCYQREPTRDTLLRFVTLVDQTARFMASYPSLVSGRYVLGPPLKSVPENTAAMATMNPTFELAYWRFGLGVAQAWRERLGQGREPKWDEVLARLAPLPQAQGRYLIMEGMADTYTKWNWEHPSLLGAYGMLPEQRETGGVDAEVMRASLKKVMEVWQWDRCWGWDFPLVAMCAAKLGEPTLAIEALMMESVKNRWHPNGHVYQRANLPAYLPANGGLLAAVAMMCVGTCSTPARSGRMPEFPRDGKWEVRWENLVPLL